jgi:hypothetical protein
LDCLLGTVVAAPVNAQTAPIVEVASVIKAAEGAAADVAVTVTCEAGLPADVTVALNEHVGSKIASGSGVTGFLCTGQPQSETVRVRAERAPFKAGVAVLSGFLSVCVQDVGSCDSALTDKSGRYDPKQVDVASKAHVGVSEPTDRGHDVELALRG